MQIVGVGCGEGVREGMWVPPALMRAVPGCHVLTSFEEVPDDAAVGLWGSPWPRQRHFRQLLASGRHYELTAGADIVLHLALPELTGPLALGGPDEVPQPGVATLVVEPYPGCRALSFLKEDEQVDAWPDPWQKHLPVRMDIREAPATALVLVRRDGETALCLDEVWGLMQRLRQPNGCPWDRAQTPLSLRRYVLEEAAEVVEAVHDGRTHKIVEELGDLLLQILFQAEIGRSECRFELRDVVAALSEKLRRRHPHVFGDMQRQHSAEGVERIWQQVKEGEPAQRERLHALSGLPDELSPVLAVQKAIEKLQPEVPSEAVARGRIAALGQSATSADDVTQLLFFAILLAHHRGVVADVETRKWLTILKSGVNWPF